MLSGTWAIEPPPAPMLRTSTLGALSGRSATIVSRATPTFPLGKPKRQSMYRPYRESGCRPSSAPLTLASAPSTPPEGPEKTVSIGRSAAAAAGMTPPSERTMLTVKSSFSASSRSCNPRRCRRDGRHHIGIGHRRHDSLVLPILPMNREERLTAISGATSGSARRRRAPRAGDWRRSEGSRRRELQLPAQSIHRRPGERDPGSSSTVDAAGSPHSLLNFTSIGEVGERIRLDHVHPGDDRPGVCERARWRISSESLGRQEANPGSTPG